METPRIPNVTIDLPPEVEASLTPYETGYLEGLCAYAVWRDGEQYVGSSGTTLRQACARFLREQGKEIPSERIVAR